MWVPKCAGRLLRESDTGHYYSNMHIKACFVLQSPDTDGQFGVPAADGPARVECSCKYNERGAITNMQMSVVASSKRVSDKVDGPFPPIVLRFAGTIAKPRPAGYIMLHRTVEQEREQAAKRHWLENTSRFKPAEMTAGLEGIRIQMLQAYTIAYIFASNAAASKMCRDGGIAATCQEGGLHTLTVCLRSPAALGWQSNAGGRFKNNVAALMGMEVDDVQAVVILGLPTKVRG